MADSSDDEPLVLSSAAMEALQEFYTEKDRNAEKFLKLKTLAEEEEAARNAAEADGYDAGKKWSMDFFTEDWNISQFWYSDETAETYARSLLSGTTSASTVVVLSTPSVFVQLKNIVSAMEPSARPRIVLLEHDARFEVFGKEFVWYDFNSPLKVPADLKSCADRIIIDPPFLSEECQTKSAMTVRLLARKSPSSATSTPLTGHSSSSASSTTSSASTSGPQSASSSSSTSSFQEDGKVGGQEDDPPCKIIICTGERMKSLLTTKLYKPLGVHVTDYEVVHARGLSNEFLCYSNFECEDWSWAES